MKLYTIGFTRKRAETFFGLLGRNSIQRVVDIRLSPDGQLSGFARKDDLPYFLSRLANGCRYVHMPQLAPTKEILHEYRADADWSRLEIRFQELMDSRDIPATLDRSGFDALASCLLCSEHTPEQCHRRLVAERLAAHWGDVEVIHL
jgi:uncharacterized protein (DUF488 family)